MHNPENRLEMGLKKNKIILNTLTTNTFYYYFSF
jgi:hypothetical protein